MKMLISLFLLSLLVFSTVSSFTDLSFQSAISYIDDEKKEIKDEKKHFSEYITTHYNNLPEGSESAGKKSNRAKSLIPSPFTNKQIRPPDHCC